MSLQDSIINYVSREEEMYCDIPIVFYERDDATWSIFINDIPIRHKFENTRSAYIYALGFIDAQEYKDV